MSQSGWDIVFVGSGDPKYDSFLDIRTGGSGPIWRLARIFAERGHDVTIIGGAEEERTVVRKKDVTILNIPVPTTPQISKSILDKLNLIGVDELSQSPGKAIDRLFGRLLFSYRICDTVKSLDPDGLFLRSRFSGFFPSRLDVPTVFTVKSPDACDFFFDRTVARHPANRLLFHYKQFLEERVIEHSDRTIVMNDVMYEYLQSKGFLGLDIVTLGVEDREIVQSAENLRENKILYVGRFDGNKRPDWLLDAFLSSDIRDYELHFIGSGPREQYLREKANNSGSSNEVVFHGRIPREEVLSEMRKSKIFVLPSEFENCPNVIIEAMASGCPVIASDTAGARYLISDGKDGLLFDKDDQLDLKKQLVELSSSEALRDTLRTNALKTIRDNHRADTIADEYWTVLERAQSARKSTSEI